MTNFKHKDDLIGIFSKHKVAANLLMIIMILLGIWGLKGLNIQFFPDFEVEIISVKTVWNGASAEDVERSLTTPIENSLKNIEDLKSMTSTSAQGISVITLEFPEGTNINDKIARVEEKVSTIRNIPENAEKTEAKHIVRYEQIAKLVVYGNIHITQLKKLADSFERELLEQGIARINKRGWPEEEIIISFNQKQLQEMNSTLDDMAKRINLISTDQPAGTIGKNNSETELRIQNQKKSIQDFGELSIFTNNDGINIKLKDIAKIERKIKDDSVLLSYKNQPAVELILQRTVGADTLESANTLEEWKNKAEKKLTDGVNLAVYDQRWELIEDRINLLLKNGISGLILVIAILYLFLNGRVATWVTVGIPVSFMATLGIAYLAGGSINMISLFALIMALGIIVDDAIVVGEDALSHYQKGEKSLEAAEGGARRMLSPVMASSLTTIAAFIPLFSVSGVIGSILSDIPFIIICVIIASLIESFLILPGHLRNSFKKIQEPSEDSFRAQWDRGFNKIRDGKFKALVTWSIHNRLSTFFMGIAAIILVVGLMASGKMGFSFFPAVPGNIIVASGSFVTGTPKEVINDFSKQLEKTLYETEKDFGKNLIKFAVVGNNIGYTENGRRTQIGNQFNSVYVELIPTDQRDVTNQEFLKKWESKIQKPTGLEYLTMAARRGGPPGRDIEIQISGNSEEKLKLAASEIANLLSNKKGTSGIEDDMPYGNTQRILEVNENGDVAGITPKQLGNELKSMIDGRVFQIFNDGLNEIEVKVQLDNEQINSHDDIDNLYIKNKHNEYIPLTSITKITEKRGFKALRHSEGALTATIFADVDNKTANANNIRNELKNGEIDKITDKYGLTWNFSGKAKQQKETAEDMKTGGIFALAIIYIVLAWAFSSYWWPLVVMSIIPFGIAGAFLGHWALGVTPTILSMFGIFALAGILVNDSIILVLFYKELKEKGVKIKEAIILSSTLRLRAVLLTSLTTIAGLLPLLFETSLQAQFLIPMAISISFGLAFGTFLVLFLIPALLSFMEQISNREQYKRDAL